MKKDPLLSKVKAERLANDVPLENPSGSPAPITLDESKIDLALEKYYANRDEALAEFDRQVAEDISDLVKALNEAER